MKENVYVIWVETRLGYIDDDEEDMEIEVELYEIVDCLETAQKEISRLNKNNLDHWNVEFWYSEEPLIRDISEANKEIYLTTPENYDYIMTLIENNKKLGKEIERLNAIIDKLNEKGKFLTEIANEKQNRIDRAMVYNNYLKEKCCYRLNEGHLRKMGKILIGEETELKEIPRVGVDKE